VDEHLSHFTPPPRLISRLDFNGAFLTMANERFGDERYAKIGLLTGLNYAAQGLGSIIISPLMKRFPTRIVLSSAVVLFGAVSAIILIVDAAKGGALKFTTATNTTQYGLWDPNGEREMT
jgi:MFS family permease